MSSKPDAKSAFQEWSGIKGLKIQPLIEVKHSITKHRFETSAFLVRIPPKTRPLIERASQSLRWTDSCWMTKAQRAQRPFSAAHKKIMATWEETRKG